MQTVLNLKTIKSQITRKTSQNFSKQRKINKILTLNQATPTNPFKSAIKPK